MFTNNDMDSVFHALAHTIRRTMLDHIRDTPGITVGQLAQNFDVSRIAVMNHLTVLEKADLVVSEKDGRSRKLYLNAMPIQTIHDRWINTYTGQWAADRTSLIQHIAEATARKTEGPEDD